MSPYPLIYCPPGVQKPACCAHLGAVRLEPGKGPGDDPAARDGGFCWGGAYRLGIGEWRRTPAGWWLCLDGHRPQHLMRMNPNPRIVKWRDARGISEDHAWRVPVLLTLQPDVGYISALDRVWNGADWSAPSDLTQLQEWLSSIISRVSLHPDLADRNRAMMKLIVGILSLGHWIDDDLLAATGWLSERMMLDIIHATCDLGSEAPAHV